VEVEGAMMNRTKVKRRKARNPGKSGLAAAKSDIRRRDCVVATVYHETLRSYPGRSLGLHRKVVTTEDERTRW